MKAVYYITEFLSRKGVEILFDYPGNAVLSVYEALSKSSIRHITVRHEQGAVHAAEGYAKSSGRVGVCLATSGPGATNLVTGLCDAMLDSVPLLAVTGQVERSSIGHDAFQEADIMGITLAVTKHNFLVKDPLELPTVLEEAWRIINTGRKGPVLIDIPRDVLESDIPESVAAHPVLPHERHNSAPLSGVKDEIADLISAAERPVIICGGGVVSAGKAAGDSLSHFSSSYNVPVVYTMMGKSGIDNHLPNVFGMLGVHGTAHATAAVKNSDLVIAIGCRFSDRSVPNAARFADKRTVIHADIDAAELCKNVFSSCPVVSDAAEFCGFLDSLPLPDGKKAEWKKWCDSIACSSEDSPAGAGEVIISRIAELCGDAIFVTDVGQHQLFAASACRVSRPGDFICSGGLGTMGFGLPAAIGAALGHPDREVVLFTGDGSIQMCLQELATVAQYGIRNLKIVIADNSCLGLVEQQYEYVYPDSGQPFCVAFNPDFSLIAAAYGLSYFDVGESSDLEAIVKQPGASIIRISMSDSEHAPYNVTERGK